MVAQAERLKISITEENRAIKALQEAAYIKGYMTAELRERERRKKARERKKRKRYFLAMFPGQEVGRTHECELWKSEKGNWLLTHEMDYSKSMGEAITEEEAKELLMRYAMPIYEKMFGELPEA